MNTCQIALNIKPLNFTALNGFRLYPTFTSHFKFSWQDVWALDNANQYKQDRFNLIDLRNIKLC